MRAAKISNIEDDRIERIDRNILDNTMEKMCITFDMKKVVNATPESSSPPSVVRLSPDSSFSSPANADDTSTYISGVSLPEKSIQDCPQYYDLDDDFLLVQDVTTIIPTKNPISKKVIALLEARGGTDKDNSGHRRDSIPITSSIANIGYMTAIYQFQDEEWDGEYDSLQHYEMAKRTNDALGRLLKSTVSVVIVRNNPGTLSIATQKKLDMLLHSLAEKGITIMSHPEVQRRMGAKDALTKIRHLKCGLPDTEVYYTPEEFQTGFLKSISAGPRVIKQNRGSQGEGIWICKLQSGNYGSTISLNDILELAEANDNHVEYHTIIEFFEFCINGRSEDSGSWISTGQGKYLEGGRAAQAMLVDQRFLPRIVEGEVRCLMVGPKLVQLVHKKPKEGGVSATLQSGAVYTKYEPTDPKFANLVRNFEDDLPKIRLAFGIEDEPYPLLWTADYIFGDEDEDGADKFYVGEFNCACVGITQQLELSELVAQVAVDVCVKK